MEDEASFCLFVLSERQKEREKGGLRDKGREVLGINRAGEC